jgi:hypothetical protein
MRKVVSYLDEGASGGLGDLANGGPRDIKRAEIADLSRNWALL